MTVDAAILCLKSGNATILRGGSEAINSNLAIAECVRHGLRESGLPIDAVQLIENTDRAVVHIYDLRESFLSLSFIREEAVTLLFMEEERKCRKTIKITLQQQAQKRQKTENDNGFQRKSKYLREIHAPLLKLLLGQN